MELMKIVLDDGKKFIFRRDSLCNNFIDKKFIETKKSFEVPLEDYLKEKFIQISEEGDYFFNTSKIKYIEIYEGNQRSGKNKHK